MDNVATINIYVNGELASTYHLEDSEVTFSERVEPIVVSLSELVTNVNLILNWNKLIKLYVSNLVRGPYSFEAEIKKQEDLEGIFEGDSVITQLTCNLETKEFIFLPRSELTVSFSIFERWTKFLLTCIEDAKGV